jgi:hypothetical protein
MRSGGPASGDFALAARHRLPAAYHARESPMAGGLMSYGADFADDYRESGNYVGRILKGEQGGKCSERPRITSCFYGLWASSVGAFWLL